MIPQPLYRIGQSVWLARSDKTTEKLTCPDCDGAEEVKLVTARGEELRAMCPRCSTGSRGPGRPVVVKHEPVVRPLTIGSIKIDTAARDGRCVQYMCRETGVGSGSVYYEDDLHPTEESAQRAAKALAAERQSAEEDTPEQQEARKVGAMPHEASLKYVHNRGLWSAWYSYRRLSEDVERLLEEWKGSTRVDREEMIEELEWALHSERRYAPNDRGFPGFFHHVRQLLDGEGDAKRVESMLDELEKGPFPEEVK